MMVADKNFRLSKASKTLITMARGSAETRNHFKSMMVQAELAAEAARRQSLKAKGNKSRDLLATE